MSRGEAQHVFFTPIVHLCARSASKATAIGKVGQLLVAAGCVEAGYAQSMVEREALANTFLGAGVAIPHGLGEDRGLVRRDGIAVLQLERGIEWNPGQIARLIVGIAAKSDSHIGILRRLTRLIQDDALLQRLYTTTDPNDIVAALERDTVSTRSAEAAADLAERMEWTVDYPIGLHARPASLWTRAAMVARTPIRVRHGNEVADARNLVDLLQLGLKWGDTITLSATESDPLVTFYRAVSALSAKEKAAATLAAEKRATPKVSWRPPDSPRVITGVAASPGLAIGRVYLLTVADPEIPDVPIAMSAGSTLLNDALVRTKAQMRTLFDQTNSRLGAGDASIFEAQAALLDDVGLITGTCQLMVAGHGVAWSWYEAVRRAAATLSGSSNAARAADMHDIGRRVLANIDLALGAATVANLPDGPTILIAPDLSPSDTAGLDTVKVVGLATTLGGPTSHTAILARTLGLPAMVAGGADLLVSPVGTLAILDGDSGRLYLNPSDEDVRSAQDWIAKRAEKQASGELKRALPARTTDGHAIAIGANVNRPGEVAFAVAQGAEGVGLMRTEFLFLERHDTPSEDEQYETYRAMLDALEGRPLIVRALDIGGDKQVPHLSLPHEANPFLGVRGARLLLRRPDLLDPQLRALYRAAKHGGDLSILFPMITSAQEVVALRHHCERIRTELGTAPVPLGVMIEVPAAALLAGKLAAYVDFFSIGTNDLTQYALAIDRQNPHLAGDADSLHPAVLRLIAAAVAGASQQRCWVGVCGDAAADPFGALLLAGLGVTELSMTPRNIPAVKARLRECDLPTMRSLVARAMEAESAADVRALEPVFR